MGMSDLGSRAIIGRIFLALEETQPPEWCSAIGMRVASDQASETYKWLGSLPAMREWMGTRDASRLETFGQTIVNRKYEATLEILRDELRRDKTDQIQMRINELAARAQQHWAKLLTEVVVAGEATACYDGQFFFDTDHAEGDSGAQSNDLTHAAASGTAPTAAEMEVGIFDALEAMLGFNDGGGEPMNQGLSELTVMVPVGLFGVTNAAMSNSIITDGTGTRTNNLVSLGGYNMRLVVNPRLASATKFYCFRSDSAIKPYILQEETTPAVEALAEGSDFAFANDAHQYGVSVSHAVGQAIWQYATVTTIT